MIKRFFLLILPLMLIGATPTQKQISSKKKELEQKELEQKKVSDQLLTVGKQIVKEQRYLDDVRKEITSLTAAIDINLQKFHEKKKELADLEKSQTTLLRKKRGLEQDIINILARELSFSLVINKTEMAHTQDLVNEEIFHALSSIAKRSIKDLKDAHKQVSEEILTTESSIKEISAFIKESESKKKKLALLEKKKKKLLTQYNRKKDSYKKRLERNFKEQQKLNELLVSLNIKNKEETEKARLAARRAEEKQRAAAAAAAAKPTRKTPAKTYAKSAPLSETDNVDVRQIGSSYTNVKTVKYKGHKTIPPLDSFDIVKKYGPYFDPVYKIKVFNESVELKSKKAGAKVKSVLDGKVVFANKTPILNNVVIVEHPGNLHTIYARLDKIAPTIKQGRKVKKGYTIGRVQDTLMFEVTKKNYHINPLDMIASSNI